MRATALALCEGALGRRVWILGFFASEPYCPVGSLCRDPHGSRTAESDVFLVFPHMRVRARAQTLSIREYVPLRDPSYSLPCELLAMSLPPVEKSRQMVSVEPGAMALVLVKDTSQRLRELNGPISKIHELGGQERVLSTPVSDPILSPVHS